MPVPDALRKGEPLIHGADAAPRSAPGKPAAASPEGAGERLQIPHFGARTRAATGISWAQRSWWAARGDAPPWLPRTPQTG